MYDLQLFGLEPVTVIALLEANVAGLSEKQLTSSRLSQSMESKLGTLKMNEPMTPEERGSAEIDRRIAEKCDEIKSLPPESLGIDRDNVDEMEKDDAADYIIRIVKRYLMTVDMVLRDSPDVLDAAVGRVCDLLNAHPVVERDVDEKLAGEF